MAKASGTSASNWSLDFSARDDSDPRANEARALVTRANRQIARGDHRRAEAGFRKALKFYEELAS
jgi:hypothetical protein